MIYIVGSLFTILILPIRSIRTFLGHIDILQNMFEIKHRRVTYQIDLGFGKSNIVICLSVKIHTHAYQSKKTLLYKWDIRKA